MTVNGYTFQSSQIRTVNCRPFLTALVRDYGKLIKEPRVGDIVPVVWTDLDLDGDIFHFLN